ncbi:hypothetical protein HT031_001699 [Scenedesmus sp. PABB004]|nr:hypothetical protein HT031_001699 [Scenedesmus sp. PABB004]
MAVDWAWLAVHWAAAAALRLALAALGAGEALLWRPEVSTPANTALKAREGARLLQLGLPPYGGAACHAPPLWLAAAAPWLERGVLSAVPGLACDLVAAGALLATAAALHAPGARASGHERDAPWLSPEALSLLYLLHPFTLLTSVAGASTAAESMAALLAVAGGVTGSAPVAGLGLALGTYLGLQPVLLAAPLALLLWRGPEDVLESVPPPPPPLTAAEAAAGSEAADGSGATAGADGAEPAAGADGAAAVNGAARGGSKPRQRRRGAAAGADGVEQEAASPAAPAAPPRSAARVAAFAAWALACGTALVALSDAVLAAHPGQQCLPAAAAWARRALRSGGPGGPGGPGPGGAARARGCWAAAVYGFSLQLRDLTPNIGLFWYFFTEMFDAFRPFFLFVLHSFPALLAAPLALRFPARPLLVAWAQLLVGAAFRPYACVGDMAPWMALLPLLQQQLAALRPGVFLANALVLLAVLGPAMWTQWIVADAANANFFYSITLLLGVWTTLLLVTALRATALVDRRLPLLLARGAGGQGLDASAEQLGAGEALTASQFDAFEEALALAAGSTGGRGNGGRGGSLTGSTAFTDAQRLGDLQRGVYYLAAAPKDFGVCDSLSVRSEGPLREPLPRRHDCNTHVPPPRDQRECQTCVAEAVATAIGMSVAATLQTDPRDWNVSAASLFYCSAGGRTCKTGFDIQEQLHLVIDEAPELIRPVSCLANDSALVDATEQARVTSWGPACDAAGRSCAYDATQPYLKCRYKSLSTFWQIQQHIRNHGAVISRITIYDDWEVQFNSSARSAAGEEWPPYSFNASAKPAFGHAVVIVGYSNTNYTWLVQNSWGAAADAGQFRTRGITADGLVRVKMGLAGVGTPDQTFGVECVPLPGSEHDPHHVQPWLRPRRVELERRDQLLDLNTSCVIYRARADDSVASIVDAFRIDMVDFVRVNSNLWGARVNMSYALSSAALAQESLQKVLDAAARVLWQEGEPLPFVSCTHYDAAGTATRVTCDNSTGAAACLRLSVNGTGKGTVGCRLNYANANVTAGLQPRKPVKICGLSQLQRPREFYSVAAFGDPEVAQIRALLGIVKALAPKFTPDASKAGRLSWWLCETYAHPVAAYLPDRAGKFQLWVEAVDSDHSPQSVKECIAHMGKEARAGKLALWGSVPASFPAFSDALLYPLLNLTGLVEIELRMFVSDGLAKLPPQLGALQHLEKLAILHCMEGALPPNWLPGWPSMRYLSLTSSSDDSSCGLTGTIPSAWLEARAPHLWFLRLARQRLSGELGAEFATAFPALQALYLGNNTFTGALSPDWAKLANLEWIDVSGNDLSGIVPPSWASLAARAKIVLDDNPQLTGCLPFGADLARRVSYAHTGITSACGQGPGEGAQWRALNTTLRALLLAGDVSASAQSAFDALLTKLNPLGVALRARETYAIRDRSTSIRLRITLRDVGGVASVGRIQGSALGLNLTHLPALAAQLPSLDWFECVSCTRNAPGTPGHGPRDLVLPPNLSQYARQLHWLVLSGCGLRGPLPPEWGSDWAPINTMRLDQNSLTGSLPTAWKDLSGLFQLFLADNRLEGTLPAEWGAAGVMSTSVWMSLSNNLKLNGTIPASWTHFTSLIDVGGTNITGCVPGSLWVITGYLRLPPCSSPDAVAMAELRALLTNSSSHGSAGPLASWSGIPDGAAWRGEGGARAALVLAPATAADRPPAPRAALRAAADSSAKPAHCAGWAGVTCSDAFRVSGLDLASLGLRLALPLTLHELTALAARLPDLQTLELAGLGLQGSLEEAAADIAGLSGLRTLNVSGNPRLSGPLPGALAGATALEVLDASGCALAGPLPEVFAMLQRLRVLRLAGNSGINGTVPLAWGIMRALEELDASGCSLTGPLPAAWAQAGAAAAAAREALAASGAAAAELPMAAAAVAAAEAQPAASGPLMARLRVLRLAGNAVTGGLPPELNAFTQLAVVDLSHNPRLGGSLPPAWAFLAQLAVRGAAQQAAGGALAGRPCPLPGSPRLAHRARLLQDLGLANCSLTGTLPFAWSSLIGLTRLDVSGNALGGALVPTYGALTALQRLGLASNTFVGAVPREWAALRRCPLGSIDLRDSPCMDAAALNASVVAAGLGGVVLIDGRPGPARPCPGGGGGGGGRRRLRA